MNIEIISRASVPRAKYFTQLVTKLDQHERGRVAITRLFQLFHIE